MALINNIQTTFSCPLDFNVEQRALLAELIMDKIRERCEQSKSAEGGKFAKYSKSYLESDDFKTAGKSKTVNLSLTGDMLASMKLITSVKGQIRIGYDKSDSLAGQVEGNQIGSYGQASGNAEKARPFLGLPDPILKSLINEVKNQIPNENVNEDIKGLINRFLNF